MSANQPTISNAFLTFLQEASGHAQAWNAAIQGLAQASVLDPKTTALAAYDSA